MKIITISDLHGRDDWKLVNPELYDKIIFLGDYVDSKDISPVIQLHNLKEIIEFKKENPDKVELLLGNHCLQYFYNDLAFNCSGYQPTMRADFHDLYNKNKDLFSFLYVKDNWIWSHAGLVQLMYSTEDLEELLHFTDKYIDKMSYAKHDLMRVGKRRGGFYEAGSFVWADKKELERDPFRGYNQIVGHTRIKHMQQFIKSETKEEIWFTDCLEYLNDFLVWEDGETKIESL